MGWKTSDGRVDWLVVFTDIDTQAIPVGALTFEGKGRVRRSVFRYARSWLTRRDPWPVATGLPLRNRATPSTPHELPLPFYDATPDGWGREILNLAFPATVFGNGEYLAAAGDNRAGDLRFGPSPEEGPAQWLPSPPLWDLPTGHETLDALLAAAEAVDDHRASQEHLHLLFRHSADIGGARPKTRIAAADGEWIAKFRAQGDLFDNPRVEAACLTVAHFCGVEVPEHKIVNIAGRSVLLVKRFDRGKRGERYGYMSAGTLVQADPFSYSTPVSYAEIATMARGAGVIPCEAALFRRMLVNCALNNTDDHLRNHAFIRIAGLWRLSPAFDIVPNKGRRLILRPAPGFEPLTDPMVAYSAYKSFRLTSEQADSILGEVRAGLRRLNDAFDQWEVTAMDRAVLGEIRPDLIHAHG